MRETHELAGTEMPVIINGRDDYALTGSLVTIIDWFSNTGDEQEWIDSYKPSALYYADRILESDLQDPESDMDVVLARTNATGQHILLHDSEIDRLGMLNNQVSEKEFANII